jgi:hypothetical protein
MGLGDGPGLVNGDRGFGQEGHGDKCTPLIENGASPSACARV